MVAIFILNLFPTALYTVDRAELEGVGVILSSSSLSCYLLSKHCAGVIIDQPDRVQVFR